MGLLNEKNFFQRFFAPKSEWRKVSVSVNLVIIIAFLVSAYSFKKIYSSYVLIFPGQIFDAWLYTSAIILAEVAGFILVSKVHILRRYNRKGDLALTWFIIILVLAFELLCNLIAHYASMLSSNMNGVEAFIRVFGGEIEIRDAMMYLSWILGGLIPIIGGITWKISTGLREALDEVKEDEEREEDRKILKNVKRRKLLDNKIMDVVDEGGKLGERHIGRVTSRRTDTDPGETGEPNSEEIVGSTTEEVGEEFSTPQGFRE